jgi:hypothetical protein
VAVALAQVEALVRVSVVAAVALAQVEALAPVPVLATVPVVQVPVPVLAAVLEALAQVPVLAAVWEMESARAALAREGASVWVAKAVGQVEALAPGLEAAEAAGVLPPGSPASERRSSRFLPCGYSQSGSRPPGPSVSVRLARWKAQRVARRHWPSPTTNSPPSSSHAQIRAPLTRSSSRGVPSRSAGTSRGRGLQRSATHWHRCIRSCRWRA